jgi:lipopolysaccharide-binding protein
LNLLKGLFEGKIKSAAESALSNAITQEVDQGLNQLLQSLPTVVSISSIAEIDYSLVSNELFTASYMTLDAKGEFYQVGHVVEAPYTPTALPDMESGNQMVQFVFSEYVPNTALYVYWAAGAISLQITPSMIPSDSPIQFNTSDWKTIVPALAAKYPGWAMKAMVSATAPPVVSFSASDISGVASSPIRMYVVNPSTGASIPVFTIGMNNTLSATVGINGNKVVGAITGYKPTIWLASSQIGNFDPTTLEQLLTFLMEGVLLPYANQYLKTGFPIPTVDGVALVNPTMGYGNHLVYIESDISYTPPASSGLTPI